jgi:hypothetical protein
VQSLAVRPVARQSPLFWIASAILVLNLFDAILTLTAVQAGAATEANPLMDASMAWGSVAFILVKMSLVSLGVTLLWQRRERPLAAAGLVALSVVYAGVIVYHLSAIGFVASRIG